MLSLFRRISASLFRPMALLLLAAGFAGCGYEAYEKRLQETRLYYSYLDKLDQNLAAAWRMPPLMALRVPNQFKELPAPQPTIGPDGTEEWPAIDPRQPDYISLSFRGLVGAWKADVNVVGGEGNETRPAYLYVASNYSMYASDQAAEASTFNQDLLTDMEGVLQTPPNVEPAVGYPKGNDYFPKQTFDVAVFHPEIPINDTRYLFETYATKQGDIQVVVIVVRPEGMDPQTKLSERIPMMLETLQVSAERPQPKQPGQPDQPATQPGGAF